MILKNELAQMQNLLNMASFQNLEGKNPPENSTAFIYKKKAALLREGKVCFAAIVQANEHLFKLFPHKNYPAQIVFSTDPYIAENPHVLQKIARHLFQYKHQPLEAVPQNLRLIVSAVKDEYDNSAYTFTLNLKDRAVTFYLTPVMFYRKLTPGRKLYGNLIPLIVAPDCRSIMVLPKKFWTRSFRSVWLQRRI